MIDGVSIQGLRWEKNWRVDNGKESYVVPFPTTRPVNLVFHGETKFDYGHYGIHLGQEDRLVFLGHSKQTITAYFIDCRKDSPTLHKRITAHFTPTSERRLCIPPGVAHAFDSLEGVFTLNYYLLFLPEPAKWLNGETEWNLDSDVINLPIEVTNEELPAFEANTCEASDVFYQLVRRKQQVNIPKLKHQYPFTQDVTLNDGQVVRLSFHKKADESANLPEWMPIEGIEGLGWKQHFVVASGDESGFIPLLDNSPFYIVDHGEQSYSHDAYGIHLGQEDRLTFLGSKNHKVKLTLVDCRKESQTLHNKVFLEFTPNPLQYLIIPNGVAHKFENLEQVFTVNRPAIFFTDEKDYQPSNDVIDWSDEKQFPVLEAHKNPASDDYYKRQSNLQEQFLSSPPKHSTPIVLLTKDSQGNPVRVALRKQVESQR